MPVSWGTSGSSRAQLRDAITGDALDDLNLPESGVSSEAISPDGRIVATVMAYPANEIRLWDLARRGPPAVLAGHKNTVLWLKFSSDGRQLASYSMDRMMRIWDTATNKSVALPSGHVLGADPTLTLVANSYPLLRRPVAARRTGSSGSVITVSPPTTR